MKKIVGIMAVAAMATSMFAADVAAKVKLTTKLFDGDKSILTTPTTSGWDTDNTYFKMSVSGDKAGAELNVWDADAAFKRLSIWFKPIDSLKITVGNNTVATIDRGTFAWWAQSVKIENKDGVKFEYTNGNLGLEFLSAESALLNFGNEGFDKVGTFWFAGKYGLGDAGTVQAFVTKGATINAYGVGGWKTGYLTMGAAYDHMPWQQTGFYGDAFVNFNNSFKFDEVGSQIGGQYCSNGMALRLTNMLAYGDKNGTTKFDYGFVAQASYAIDAYTPYAKVLGYSILDKKIEAEVGVDFNVGACAINAAVNVPMNFADMGATKVTVPLYFTVAF